MRRPVPTRMIAVALAAGSMLMVPLAATAGAATPTLCTKATFSPSTTTAGTQTAKSTLGGCNNPAITGGSGVLVATYSTNGTTASGVKGKITWKGTGTSSFTVKSGAGSKAAAAKCHGTGADEGLAHPQHGHARGRHEQGQGAERYEVHRVALHSLREGRLEDDHHRVPVAGQQDRHLTTAS